MRIFVKGARDSDLKTRLTMLWLVATCKVYIIRSLLYLYYMVVNNERLDFNGIYLGFSLHYVHTYVVLQQ